MTSEICACTSTLQGLAPAPAGRGLVGGEQPLGDTLIEFSCWCWPAITKSLSSALPAPPDVRPEELAKLPVISSSDPGGACRGAGALWLDRLFGLSATNTALPTTPPSSTHSSSLLSPETMCCAAAARALPATLALPGVPRELTAVPATPTSLAEDAEGLATKRGGRAPKMRGTSLAGIGVAILR